jgi:DNA-binding NtrC family response regulator
MVLVLMRRVLQSAGFQVHTAQTERQAIEALRSAGCIRIAILDRCIPGTSGERVFDQVAAECPGIKVIVASGEDPQEVEQAFSGRKVDCFVRKPFDNGTLLAAVKSALMA